MANAARGEVSFRLDVPASADRVWALIADFGAIDQYSPMVTSCRVEGGDGVGQRRVLTLENGTVTISRLEAIDPAARTLTYRIVETKLPLEDYTSTMEVREKDNDLCEVIWTSDFLPRDASLEEARSFLEGSLGDSIRDLRAVFVGTTGSGGTGA